MNQIDNISHRASYIVDYLFQEDTGMYIADRTNLEMVDFDKGDMIWIEYLEVAEEHRKKGIARKMLREARNEIQEAVDSCFMITYSIPEIPASNVYRSDDHEKYSRLLQAFGFRRARGTPFFIHIPQFDEGL